MEEKFEVSHESQKKIFAMMLSDSEFLKSYGGQIKPDYFDNPILKDLSKIVISFYEKYSRTPDTNEFLEEYNAFIEKENKRQKGFPLDEYSKVTIEIFEIGKAGGFDYVRDKVGDFARRQEAKRIMLNVDVEKLNQKAYVESIANELIKIAIAGDEDAGLRSLTEVEAKDVEWLWENHIPLGEITLLIGDPGIGKSYFSYFLSAQVSKGGCWPDNLSKSIKTGKVLILSTDEDPNYAIRPRADAAGADTDKIFVLEGSRDEQGRIKILNLTKDIHRLEKILEKDKGYRLVMIDPLSDYFGRIDSHKYSDVRWAMAPINALARKYHVAIVGIMHCNKNTSLQVLYRIMGSMGFPSVARSIWLVAKDREDEENKRRYFSPLKNNLAPEQATLAFQLENLGKVAKVVFESEPVEQDFDVEDMLVPQERTSETKRARRFLLETLKHGAMLAAEVKKAARDEGISWGTLRRAKDKLSVNSIKENKPGGKWFWELNEFTRRTALVEAESKSEERKTEEKTEVE
jgi:putative DNA primase/helicase